jgi:hypothetical protein
MSCSFCQDCRAVEDVNVRCLDISTFADEKNCTVGGNGNHYQKVMVESYRPKKVYMRFSASSRNNGIKISGPDQKEKQVDRWGNGEVEFVLEKNGNSRSRREIVDIDVEVRFNKDQAWRDLTQLTPERRLP